MRWHRIEVNIPAPAPKERYFMVKFKEKKNGVDVGFERLLVALNKGGVRLQMLRLHPQAKIHSIINGKN